LERRRRRAVELVEGGESPCVVARILGVHENSVHRWLRLARLEGGLDAKLHPGRKPGLDEAQLAELERLLLQGAKQHGWANNLWTADRVKLLIQRHFQIDYHPEHVRKILKRRLNWSSQKPQLRAREQDEKEVARWKDDEFSRIVREAHYRLAHLIFLDESGFMLSPTVRRTLAPRGQTPILPAFKSCVTMSPQLGEPDLFFELLPEGLNVTAEDIVAFLNQLKEELPGPWTVIWDRHNIHSRSCLVKAWLAEHPDVVLEDLPPYAPELNPDEMVWGWLKYAQLANLTPCHVHELRDHLLHELQWAAFDSELLDGFLAHAILGSN
jgi:transposase